MTSIDPPLRRPQRSEFPPVLTTALAAELLQLHAESLRKMVREGRIPCHRLGGGRGMRFLRDELLAWLAAQPGTAGGASGAGARIEGARIEGGPIEGALDPGVNRWAAPAPIEGR